MKFIKFSWVPSTSNIVKGFSRISFDSTKIYAEILEIIYPFK